MTFDRHAQIVELARTTGGVAVEALAERFGVSEQTIRKDLKSLSARGALKRVHGGAVYPSSRENVEYEARRRMAAAQKDAIGRAAAALIPDGAAVFVNIGTTTEAAARALGSHASLMIITNNINVANQLRVLPGFEVVIAGGVVRASDGGIVGEAAVDFFRQFRADYAIIGASAMDELGGLYDYDFREVKVAQAIIANARHAILVSDSTKFERSAPVRIARIEDVGTFVTDRAPEAIRGLCARTGTRLIETEPD
jgi:DeoR family glycerol-3-phosphate regulon repressor